MRWNISRPPLGSAPETDYMHYQLQAAYRKESRIGDADRELKLYKELKAKQRDATAPPFRQPSIREASAMGTI